MKLSSFTAIFRGWGLYILASIVLRLAVLPYSYAGDFYSVVRAVYEGYNNPSTLLTLQYWVYPPLGLYLLMPFYAVASVFGFIPRYTIDVNQWWLLITEGNQIPPQVVMLLKLPNLIAEVITGYLLFRFFTEYYGIDRKRSYKLVAILWFFNPVPFWYSDVTGHFDILPTLFSFLALYLFRTKKLWSFLSLGIGIALKEWPILLLPFFLFKILNGTCSHKRKCADVAVYSLVSLLPIALVTLPGLLYTTLLALNLHQGFLLRFYQSQLANYTYGQENWLFGYLLPVGYDGPMTFPSYLPITLVLLLTVYYVGYSQQDILQSIAVAIFLLYGFSPFSGQWLVWSMPFLVAGFVRTREARFAMITMYLVQIILMIISYGYYGFGYTIFKFLPDFNSGPLVALRSSIDLQFLLRAGLGASSAIMLLGLVKQHLIRTEGKTSCDFSSST